MVLLAGCGGSGDDAPSVSEVNAAGDDLNESIGDYLAIPAPDGSSPEAWSTFYDEGDARIAEIRENYERWSDMFDRSVEDGNGDGQAGLDNLAEYRNVLGEWIDAQEEQARLSRACVEGESQDAAARCLADMVAENGDRWNAIAAELNRIGGGAELGD